MSLIILQIPYYLKQTYCKSMRSSLNATAFTIAILFTFSCEDNPVNIYRKPIQCLKVSGARYSFGAISDSIYYSYNDKNLLSKQKTIDQATSKITYKIYQYTSFDSVSDLTAIDSDSNILYQNLYSYNENNLLSSVFTFYNIYNTTFISKYKYNGLNQLYLEEQYDSEDQLKSFTITQYDSQGNIAKTIRHHPDSTVNIATNYFYNSAGKPTSSFSVKGNSDTTKCIFQYDINNNLIEQKCTDVNTNETRRYQHEYDSYNNCIAQRWMNSDSEIVSEQNDLFICQ